MAVPFEEQQLAQKVYAALKAASCPLIVGLHLLEADSMHTLLCTPSQHRTEILAWICNCINPNPKNVKTSVIQSKDPNFQTKEMAMLGRELMLCKAEDFDLIQGHVKPLRQLHFLQELLTLVPGCFTESEVDEEGLLNELYADENRALLTHMLRPTLNPWPAHIKYFSNDKTSSVSQTSQQESADVAALLQAAGRVLKDLQSECEFLHSECQSPAVFSPCALRVAVSDLCQLTAAFRRVYETDFKDYCRRKAPPLSAATLVFQRVHRLLLSCNTELKMLEELSQASQALTEKACQLQTQPCYWSHGEKCTLPDQLEKITRQYKDFLSQPSAQQEK
ncbi:HAUS augmin-like complex subunit 7 [Gadus macrocephalus]|uniref:HAUS augmin-like complex subunit 7 n=1 Tax=Gadus macrocephalus TaxID=80720 RepID=UPI0028CB35C8|nr:HAUS augmin-like complex subunit 7 [Gadus macrocephalus]